MVEYMHVSKESWMLYLAQGWRLPFVVQPTIGNHGNYSITLWRPVQEGSV